MDDLRYPAAMKDLLTYKQAGAALLGVSVSTIQRLVRSGELANVRVGGRVYIHRDALGRYVEGAHAAGLARQRDRAKRGSRRLRRAG